ncbi:MAG: membrane protein insertion efficiency factor YidD [Sorangium cellulosum]|nr:MAG: membrane protein insertion efficiency factor YidD [Sorangium cellulosum]
MIVKLLLALIRLYQLTLSPLLGPVCRFEPSCSQYAFACLRDHGLLRGSWLSILRLGKCHPFHPGGFDPPPPLLASGRSDSSVAAKPPSA